MADIFENFTATEIVEQFNKNLYTTLTDNSMIQSIISTLPKDANSQVLIDALEEARLVSNEAVKATIEEEARNIVTNAFEAFNNALAKNYPGINVTSNNYLVNSTENKNELVVLKSFLDWLESFGNATLQDFNITEYYTFFTKKVPSSFNHNNKFTTTASDDFQHEIAGVRNLPTFKADLSDWEVAPTGAEKYYTPKVVLEDAIIQVLGTSTPTTSFRHRLPTVRSRSFMKSITFSTLKGPQEFKYGKPSIPVFNDSQDVSKALITYLSGSATKLPPATLAADETYSSPAYEFMPTSTLEATKHRLRFRHRQIDGEYEQVAFVVNPYEQRQQENNFVFNTLTAGQFRDVENEINGSSGLKLNTPTPTPTTETNKALLENYHKNLANNKKKLEIDTSIRSLLSRVPDLMQNDYYVIFSYEDNVLMSLSDIAKTGDSDLVLGNKIAASNVDSVDAIINAFGVRLKGINIPTPKVDTFDTQFLGRTIKRIGSTFTVSRKADLTFDLDEQGLMLKMFSDLGGASSLMNKREKKHLSEIYLSQENLPNITLLNNRVNLHVFYNDNRANMTKLVQHREDDGTYKQYDSAVADINSYREYILEDVRFLGTSGNLEFKKNGPSVMSVTVPVIFKRVSTVDHNSL